jgi:DNA (cytosine-5)-methyltransferase 1
MKYISIKQASKMLGVTPLTLRNWDKLGKLRAYRNPVNNYRVYRADQIEVFLRRMESHGSTRDIR